MRLLNVLMQMIRHVDHQDGLEEVFPVFALSERGPTSVYALISHHYRQASGLLKSNWCMNDMDYHLIS